MLSRSRAALVLVTVGIFKNNCYIWLLYETTIHSHMKRLLLLSLLLLAAMAATFCSKSSSESKDPFRGVWYISTIVEEEKGKDAVVTKGTAEQYWEFKTNGTVLVHDTSIPELGGGSVPKPFSFQAETRTLTMDAFTFEVLVSNNSELRLKSQFSPEVWNRDSYLVISFQRTTKGL